jgi:mycothiol system anti-sigma-R factor
VTHPMTCDDAVRRLWHLLDGDLRPGEAQLVEEHLDQCVTCCGELEFSRELRKLLAAQRGAALPVEVRERLHRFVDRLDQTGEQERGRP